MVAAPELLRVERCGGLLTLMALALAGVGCGSSRLKEPFPCAADHTCPAHYQCGSDNLCRTAMVGADASTDAVDGNADAIDGSDDKADDDMADANPDDMADANPDGMGGDAEGGVDRPPLVATGQPCSFDGDCSSSACVDGVCCENACPGTCKACAMTSTGQADGTCALALAGKDPHNDCAAGTPEQCGDDGMCDGAGACRKYGTGQVCAAATCAGTQFHPTQTCTGTGTCATVAPVECGAFACSASGCAKPCTGDGDCPAQNYCVASSGLCKAKKINGDTCTLANECMSSQCADGFCCDAACAATCNACSNAKTGQPNGHCAPIPAGQDPDNECTAGPACGLDGTCNGSNGCRFTAANTPCGPAASCSGTSVYTPVGSCDGVGACTPGTAQNCPGHFTCASSTACRTTCALASSMTDCTPGRYCSGSSCVLTKAVGVACSANIECASGFCVDGVCCSTSCALASAASGMCMGCSAAVTGGLANGTCGPRTGSSTRACPAANPTACVNQQTDVLNCGQCGTVCPTSGLPAGTTRACLFGNCGASCAGTGNQLCTPDTGPKTCTPTVWGFESGSTVPWLNSAETSSMTSMDQHHSGSWSLSVSPSSYPGYAATTLTLPCTPDLTVGTMDVRGKTFSAWVFVVNSTSSYAGTSCSLHATDRNFAESLLPASSMTAPIVPGTWFQLSATFPTTSLESMIYKLAIECTLPSDWAFDDMTKWWFVDDIRVN